MDDLLLNQLSCKSLQMIKNAPFDCLTLGIIDFKKNTFQHFEIENKTNLRLHGHLWFDLASLSKPLNLSAVYYKSPQQFDESMLMLLEHRGGLPSWGLLSSKSYREQLDSYSIKPSPNKYSDFSSIRLMMEIEKKMNRPLKDIASFYWDKELCHWQDLDKKSPTPMTGQRKGKSVYGDVHDPNAYNITAFTPHSGIFATMKGFCSSLINLNNQTDFIKKEKMEIKKRPNDPFIWGWDRVSKGDTLAGKGCGPETFGHLGFTGTMIWIDPNYEIGYALFTNATKYFCHNRTSLNKIRKTLGQMIWYNQNTNK